MTTELEATRATLQTIVDYILAETADTPRASSATKSFIRQEMRELASMTVDPGGCAPPVYVPRSDELRAAGAKVVNVPAIPVQPAPNYRIQIEDGAWVGTLDEWRALIALTGTRDKFKAYVHERLDKMGVPHSTPESEHDKARCRVGGRLDWVQDHLALLHGREAAREADYCVVEGRDLSMLAADVARLLAKGWECAGGVAIAAHVGDPWYVQAMVRK